MRPLKGDDNNNNNLINWLPLVVFFGESFMCVKFT